jgi:hypothetical protein
MGCDGQNMYAALVLLEQNDIGRCRVKHSKAFCASALYVYSLLSFKSAVTSYCQLRADLLLMSSAGPSGPGLIVRVMTWRSHPPRAHRLPCGVCSGCRARDPGPRRRLGQAHFAAPPSAIREQQRSNLRHRHVARSYPRDHCHVCSHLKLAWFLH